MSDQTFKCLVCHTVLPTDAPKTVGSISCTFCNQPNPNPKNISDGNPAPYTRTGSGSQNIQLKESSVSQLFSISSIAIGITLVIFFAFRRPTVHYLLLSSILVLLPIFGTYFVPYHWEKLAKWATSESGDKYTVSYEKMGVDWINYLESYIFQVWLFGILFTNIIRPYDNENLIILVSLLALVIGFAVVWITDLTIKITASALGKIISRK